MSEPERHANHVGVPVYCPLCGRIKKPVGRSAAPGMANGLCDDECEGYRQEPYAQQLWPGESCEEFGYCWGKR